MFPKSKWLYVFANIFGKILKLSMKALVEKDINEETRKRDEEGSTFLLCTFIFFIW